MMGKMRTKTMMRMESWMILDLMDDGADHSCPTNASKHSDARMKNLTSERLTHALSLSLSLGRGH